MADVPDRPNEQAVEMTELTEVVPSTSPRSVFSVLSLARAPTVPPITPRLAFHVPSPAASELDLGDAMIDADDFLGPPALDPLDDGKSTYQLPQPARAPTPERKAAAARRRRRARALSEVSASTRKGARSRLRKLVRRDSGSSSSSSSSSSSASSTHRSGISNVSRSRWRFWRNDSSDSETSDDDDDSYIPPDPSYNLTLPSLAIESYRAAPFNSASAPTLTAALSRLTTFWAERRQTHHEGGDLGDHVTPSAGAQPKRGVHLPTAIPERELGDGAGWWLDIQCPTVQDMRQLRKHLPLHPLTIEDILHQDPREKTERFDSLNYTFVVFRALDESYFRWTASEGSPVLSPASSASPANSKDDLDAKERDEASEEGARQPRRGRVEIVEGVGGKEGVEGVGVGAVNLYLVIFADGLLTFHFEPLPKHTGRVLSKIQQYGLGRPINSSWMAYGLMDSIVDAFFPLVNFIESESKTIDDYLSDPIALEDPTLHRSRPAPRSKRRWQLAQWRMRLLRHLPRVLFFPRRSSADLIAMDDLVLRDRDKLAASHAITPDTDRKVLLLRLAESRKLVTAMSRLLTPKRDVVRGLRKRVTDIVTPTERDISMYFGDLQDHIMTLHQSLIYYESVLSHDHPAFSGILRVGLEQTKQSTDRLILRLYIVILLVLPCQILIGLFSLNIRIPANGDRETHLEPDGVTLAPFNVFGIVVAGVLVIATVVITGSWLVVRSLDRRDSRAVR